MWKFFVIILFVFVAAGQGRHIHHKRIEDENILLIKDPEIDGMSIDVIQNTRRSHFVPMNNIIFFKSYEPCQDGFKRDLLGICRDVWDD